LGKKTKTTLEKVGGGAALEVVKQIASKVMAEIDKQIHRPFITFRANAYSRFATLGSTTVPSGNTTTKNNWRNGPVTVSEKQTSQNGTGLLRSS